VVSCATTLSRRAPDRRALLAGLALLGLLSLTAATAQPAPLRIETIQSEPFGYLNAHGRGGMMYEIGNLIAARAGLPADNQIVPYARTVLSLSTGSADMVIRFGNAELEQAAHQVAAVLELPVEVLGLRDGGIRQLADLAGRQVTMARSFPQDAALSAVPGIRIVPVRNNDMAVRMLFAGRVDAVFGSHLGLYGAAVRLGLPVQQFGPPIVLGSQTFWLHLSRKTATPERMEQLRQAVESLRRDGSIERIYRRYLVQAGEVGGGGR
jgi:polar amino acid transport system substrate-binding protein